MEARYDERPGGSSRGRRPPSYDADDSRELPSPYDDRGRRRGGNRYDGGYDARDRRDDRGGRYGDGRRSRDPRDGVEDSAAYAAPGRGRRRPRYEEPTGESEAYPAARGRPRSARRDETAEAPARRLPLIALLGILVVVLAVPGVLLGPKVLAKLGVGAAAPYQGPKGTYTPGPTPTTLPNFKKFVSARALYSMDYPAAWTVSAKEQTVQGQYDHIDVFMAAPTNASTAIYVEQAGAASSVSDADVIASEVAGVQQAGVTLTLTASAAPTQNIGGEIWQQRDYLVNGNGPATHEAILAGHHAGRSYVILLVSAPGDFAGDTTASFTPALKSFRFAG